MKKKCKCGHLSDTPFCPMCGAKLRDVKRCFCGDTIEGGLLCGCSRTPPMGGGGSMWDYYEGSDPDPLGLDDDHAFACVGFHGDSVAGSRY